MFYSFDKIQTYNSILKFIIGERGVGKTYGAKKMVAKRFIKNGSEFVYVRRYKTELKSATKNFWQQIANDPEVKEHKFKSTDKTFFIDGKPCGYAIALSTANILKSSTFDNVKTIIFDEFIIDKGAYHYLQNEVTQMLDLIETIGRLRDIEVYFLGNAITISNPYFNYFDLSLPYNSEFKTFNNGLIVVNYIKNLEYRETKKQSKFGQLIQNTEYGKYAIDNEFLRDNKNFIKKKTGNCSYYMTLVYNNVTYGIWQNDINELIVSLDFNKTSLTKFTLSNENHNDSTKLIGLNNILFKNLIAYYRNGYLFFESQKIKSNLIDLLI